GPAARMYPYAPEVSSHSWLEERTLDRAEWPARAQLEPVHRAAVRSVTPTAGSALDQGLLRLLSAPCAGRSAARLAATAGLARELLRVMLQRIVGAADLQRRLDHDVGQFPGE